MTHRYTTVFGSYAPSTPFLALAALEIRHAIETGVLQQGDVLPGTRTLAEQLVVSPNTVVRHAQERVRALVERLQGDGFSEEAIQRLVDAELFYRAPAAQKRAQSQSDHERIAHGVERRDF
jgi:DNA-binding transcriptional MocR family regulator